MVDPEELNEWLKKAEEDWRVAEILLISGEELTLPCMFHLQQVLEKLLKALILKKGGRIERTQDLDRLAQLAELQEMEGLLDLCDVLALFAVNGRYPGDLPEIAISVARNYFESAKGIRSSLLEQIRASGT
jgi:HEPN domain-containing protein